MNPQIAKMHDSSTPGEQPPPDNGASDETDSFVELHKGGNPSGQPPPTETTQYHTIHGADIRNHDDYDGADSHMKECMGESDGMGDLGVGAGDLGGGQLI